jgi:hypothetical protein
LKKKDCVRLRENKWQDTKMMRSLQDLMPSSKKSWRQNNGMQRQALLPAKKKDKHCLSLVLPLVNVSAILCEQTANPCPHYFALVT